MKLKRNIKPYGLDIWLTPERGGISPGLYYCDNGRELAFMHLIDTTVKAGVVCIDVGANIGYTTLAILKNVGKEGFVYAIDPDSRNIDVLKKNIEHNKFGGICEVCRCVLSDTDGKVDFWLDKNPNLSAVDKSELRGRTPSGKIQVDSFTLGTFLKHRRYPNFIKMDIEGHEVKVLRAALDYFKENNGKTDILLECHPYVGNPHCSDPDRNLAEELRKYFEIGFNAKYAVTGAVAKPKKFVERGYEPFKVVQSDGFTRGTYKGITNEHLIELSCLQPQVCRSIMIGR